MDPKEVQQLTRELQLVTQSMQQLSVALSQGFQNLEKDGKKAAKSIGDEWQRTLDPKALTALNTTYVNTNVSMFSKLQEKAKELKKDFYKTFEIKEDWAKNVNLMSNAKGAFSAAAAGNAQGMISSMTAGIPIPFVGGLLGLMLMGRQQETKFAALGEQAAQVFKKVGAVGGNTVRELTGDIKQLSIAGMASEGDIAAVADAFASMGISAAEAKQSMGMDLGVKGIRDSAINATLAMDKLFQNASGAGAKSASEIMTNMNVEFKDAVNIYKDMSFAARDAGMSQQMFVGSIMQASSALRVQGGDVKFLGAALLKTRENYIAQGMDAQRANEMAANGVKQIGNAIANMSVGMKSFIGRQIDPTLGAVEASIAMERGFRGTKHEKTFLQDTSRVMLDMGSKAGGDKSDDKFIFNLKALHGVSLEGAEAMLAVKKSMDKGLTLEEATKKNQEELAHAFGQQAKKEDQMIQIMRQLQTAIANLGSGFLSIMIGGIRSTEMLLKWGFNTLASYFREFFGEKENKIEEQTFRKSLDDGFSKSVTDLATANNAAFKDTTNAMSALAKVAGKAGNTFFRGELLKETALDRILRQREESQEDDRNGVNKHKVKFKQSKLVKTGGKILQVDTTVKVVGDDSKEEAP